MRRARLGASVARVDGRLKVTGSAHFPSDIMLDGAVHAVMVTSQIASGTIRSIDTTRALSSPGIIHVMTPDNAPPIQRIPFSLFQPDGSEGHGLLPLQEKTVYYADQPVALVVAATPEQAYYAASLVQVEYDARNAEVDLSEDSKQERLQINLTSYDTFAHTLRGQPHEAFEALPIQMRETYTTAMMSHNPLSPLATVAYWVGPTLTVYDATQGIGLVRAALAATFALPLEHVRVIATFVGGTFGCGLRLWPHTILTAMAARVLDLPVKLVLTRKQMFTAVGHRPPTIQHLTLGATREGKLVSMSHQVLSQTSSFDEYVEPVANGTRQLYACSNVETDYRLIRLATNTPALMRAPGESPGSFALESALDELSYELGLDPIELRLRNYADRHPETALPWSSNALKECYQRGARRFGWARRPPMPRSMRDGNELVGWGMATASYPYGQLPAQAEAILLADGSAVIRIGTTDIGTGTSTSMTQIAAEALGLSLASVRCELGDSNFASAPPQIGSLTTSSVGPAVWAAASAVRDRALALTVADPASPCYGAQTDEISVELGRLFLTQTPSRGETYKELLARQQLQQIRETAATSAEETPASATRGFGAHFVEVCVDPDLGRVRVTRTVGAFGVGRVLNPKLARSQMLGGLVWGIGMALSEETLFDHPSSRVINANLADYHIPVAADIPQAEILFVEEQDPSINPLGVKGLAELCVVGVAAAIANAVYHATGKRIRDLPITLDKLLPPGPTVP